MLSKSTKRKRRQKSKYYQAVATIRIAVIDTKSNVNFYLLSLPETPSRSRHIEVRGELEMMIAYRKLLVACR